MTMIKDQNHQLLIKRKVAQCPHARDVKTRHDERNIMVVLVVMVLRINGFFAFYDVRIRRLGLVITITGNF
jgi:hypothetical protein